MTLTLRVPTREAPWVEVSERHPTIEEWLREPIVVICETDEYAARHLTVQTSPPEGPAQWRNYANHISHWTFARLIIPANIGPSEAPKQGVP